MPMLITNTFHLRKSLVAMKKMMILEMMSLKDWRQKVEDNFPFLII